MTTELSNTSIVNQITIKDASMVPQGYYRSKLFIAPFSTNALVAAAGPLLSLFERLCLSPSLPSVDQIRESIEHEMHAFHCKLQAADYTAELIAVAHYVLAATVDELLGKNYLRLYNEAPGFKSFAPLSADGVEPQERFFEILDYAKDRPNQFLDLIELIYFCLVAGFEGKYHHRADGRQCLDNHIDALYQIVNEYRFNKPHRLFSEKPIPKLVSRSYKAVFLTVFAASTLVAAVFFTSHILLENRAKAVLLGHSQLALLDD